MNDTVVVYLKRGQPRAALNQVDQFLTDSSQQSFLLSLKGRIYLGQQAYAQASAAFRNAITRNPDNFQAHFLLAEINVRQGNIGEALAEVDRIIARKEDFASAHMLRAYYLHRLGDGEGAIRSYRRTLELSPDNHIAANNLAWIYGETDRLKKP